MHEDYYIEINKDNKTRGPKRTLDFFLDTVRKGKQYILDLYNPRNLRNSLLFRKSMQVIKEFGLCDSELELELAKILTTTMRMPEPDRNKLVTEYMLDLSNRFLFNLEQEDSFQERKYEYASFRGSADYVTIFYGMATRPILEMLKKEAEMFSKKFFEGKRKGLSIKEILDNGQMFYNSASEAAREILEIDSFRLKDSDKRRWEKRASIDEKITERYHGCLEILRTARYRFLN